MKEKNQASGLNKKFEAWCKDNIPETEEEREPLMNWGRLCERAIDDQLDIGVDHPEMCIAIYCHTFEQIVARLVKERVDNSSFSINIGDVVSIGFSDEAAKNDEDSEKIGNIVPFIYDLGGDKFELGKKELADSGAVTADELTSAERCSAWASAHILTQKKTLNEIAEATLQELAKIEIELPSPVVIYPLFAICHQQLREYVKLLQHESGSSAASLDICGNFTAVAYLVDEGEVVVDYKPDPSFKLAVKSDAHATAGKEDGLEE